MAFRTDGAALTQRSIYASWTQRENESNTMRDLSPPATVHTLGPSRQFFYLAQTGGPFPGHPPPGGAVSAEGVASSRIFVRQSGLGPPGRGWLMSSIGTRPADVNSRLPEPITNWTHRPEASEARCLGTTAVRCPPGAGPGADTSPHGRKCQPCAEIRSFRRKSLRSERGLWLPAPRAVLKPRYGNKDTTVFLMLLVEIRPRTTRDSLSCLNCRDTDAFNKERAFPGLCS